MRIPFYHWLGTESLKALNLAAHRTIFSGATMALDNERNFSCNQYHAA